MSVLLLPSTHQSTAEHPSGAMPSAADSPSSLPSPSPATIPPPAAGCPVFTLQLTAAPGSSRRLSDAGSDAGESTTSELPYPACELKRVRFPCPVAEAERFASTHLTYSPAEYDRTPILISEEGRSCVLPERGSKRCYFYTPPEEADAAAPAEVDDDDDAEASASDGEADAPSSGESSLSNAEEDEMMDRRIAMMRSMALAAAAGADADSDDGRIEFSTGGPSPVGGGDGDAPQGASALGPAVQRELDDELVRIRERCRTRFGLWRVETAEFASEDPNGSSSPRQPCTPNPSPLSPPASLADSTMFSPADLSSPSPAGPSPFSYFAGAAARASSPIAIPARSSSAGSSASASGYHADGGSFDGATSATPTSSLVGLSITRRRTTTAGDDDDDDDTDSPASLGAASPATRRMMWCQQMKLRCAPMPVPSPAADDHDDDSDGSDAEDAEHRDDGLGMRRWLSGSGGRTVSDSPPPTPGWDHGASSFLDGGRPSGSSSSSGGFPLTRVETARGEQASLRSSSACTNGSSSTINLLSLATAVGDVAAVVFEKRATSPPTTPLTAAGAGVSLLRSSLGPSSSSSPASADALAATPTSSSDASSTPTTVPSAPASAGRKLSADGAVQPPGSLALLASPSSSACSSSDTGSFSTDSDPPSLASLRTTDDDDDDGVDRWDLSRELSGSPCFRAAGRAGSTSAADKLDLFGAGGWAEGAEASEFMLGSRSVW